MSRFDKEIFLEQFREIYEGVSEGRPTWVVSNEVGSGVLPTVEGLSARQASALPCGELSIAAHAGHLRWSLGYALDFYRGGSPRPDWSGSWSDNSVAPDEWKKLRSDLRRSFEDLVRAVEVHEDYSDRNMVAGTLALVPHAAYHLGVMRHLRKLVLVD